MKEPDVSRGLGGFLFGAGARVASTVYGTVVVMATLTAAYATQKDPTKLAVLVASTVVVLWIAHLYAHALAERIEYRRRLTGRETIDLAARELGILLAALPPITALVLGAAGVMQESRAVWLALAIGLLILGAEGLRFARLERLGPLSTALAIVANLAVGLLVVALKVIVVH